MRSAPTKGTSAGSVCSSTSKLMAHWRAKYSDGAQREVGAEAAEGLRLLVEALEPEGRPAARGLQEDDTQSRVALEDAEGDELGAGQHLLERVRHGVQDQRVEGAVGAERRHDHRAALVDADRHIELLGRVPQRVVGAVGQRAAEARVGPDEAGHEAELGRRPGAARRRPPPGPAAGAWRRRRGGRGRRRSSRPASRCRRRRARRPPRGPRRPRSTARWSGRARPGRCPRRPCRPAGPTGRTRRAGRRPAGGRPRGRRRSSRGGRGCRAARPGSRCRPRPRARSRGRRR